MSIKKQSPATTRRWRSGRVLLVAGIVAGLSAGALAPTPAGAATSSTLLYSTDGGSTWSSSATVPAGGTVLVRQWYDNTGSASETGASLRTTVPAGFTLQGGSTEVCLNPSTTDPSSPSSTELVCEDSDEGAVWSGSDLQISPSAGFNDESNGSTSGSIAVGRKRYLNLHQCVYGPTADKISSFHNSLGTSRFKAGTNASNSVDPAPVCDIGSASYLPDSALSGVQTFDLLGNRYLNLHQCSWYSATSTDTFTSIIGTGPAAFTAGTNASSNIDSSVSCSAGTAPYTPSSSQVFAFDLRDNRYLNLHQCMWFPTGASDNVTYLLPNSTIAAGSNASNSADPALSCGSGGGLNFNTSNSGVKALDLLDTTRGAGYVQYALAAPATPSPMACAAAFAGTEAFTQDGTYQSDQTPVASSTGNLTVDFSALSEPCPVDPIPTVDPVVGGALVAVAGAGYLLYRRTRPQAV